ncbi:hypothetical protein [Mesorhizobium sp. LNJC395A00]|uniref:hypothetical protein n=1 Tax=unclassified Mesorhizobium TaxID=325217 RepID=UPI0012EC1F3F|nr:hypothetical protein [Mesorhizobium sp. LNJC395A00]
MKNSNVYCAIGCFFALSACADQRINHSQADLGQNLYNAQYQQINYQISKSIDDPYSVPSFTFVSSSVLGATESVTAAGTYTSAAAGLTRQFTGTVGGMGNSFLYTSSPISDPDALRMVRDIYAYTVGETPWRTEFSKLKIPPPRERWLVVSNENGSVDRANLVLIGKFGSHVLWTNSRRAYSDFVLSVLSALAPSEEPAAAGKAKGKSPKSAAPRSFVPKTQPLFVLPTQ